MYDIIIIGGGAAGLTAGIYATRGGAKTLVLAGAAVGGQTVQTDLIENFSGVPSVDGYTLMEAMRKQAISAGAEIKCEEVKDIRLGKEKHVVTEANEYLAKAVIIATGARHRKLGISREDELTGAGISYCATCDGGFFRKKAVAVVGGGDSALTEALYLSNLCSEVYLIHRRGEYRAAKVLVERIKEKENIVPVLDSVVTELNGNPLESIEIIEHGKTRTLSVRALFVAIGTEPDTRLVYDKLDLCKGYILTDERMRTSYEGVFAAGDVRLGPLKQIITACADGAVAATSALEYVNN